MSRDVCAVDYSTNVIQMMLRPRNGVPIATEAELPAEAIEDGKVQHPIAVQLYLARLFKDLKIKSADLRLTISDSACVTRYLDYPKLSPRDLERSLHFEAARELPMNVRDAYLGWQVVDERERQLTVLLVAAWRDVVETYVEALQVPGRLTAIEPRSLALARAAGVSDATLVDWTGNRIQVVVVERRRVTYTAGVLVANGAAESNPRLVHLMSGLVPKAPGHRPTLPSRLVLMGRLSGRTDLAESLSQASVFGRFGEATDWEPPEPYRTFGHSCQAANVGMMLRN